MGDLMIEIKTGSLYIIKIYTDNNKGIIMIVFKPFSEFFE